MLLFAMFRKRQVVLGEKNLMNGGFGTGHKYNHERKGEAFERERDGFCHGEELHRKVGKKIGQNGHANDESVKF